MYGLQYFLDRLIMKDRICFICGCTDFNCTNCVEKTGKPCHWISDEHNICSDCLHTALDLAENFLFIMRKNEKDPPEEVIRMIKLNYKRFQEKNGK